MIIDAPDDLRPAAVAARAEGGGAARPAALREDEGGPRHQPRRHRPHLPLRRVPGDEPVRHGRRARALRPLGRRACCTPSPNEGSAERQGRVRSRATSSSCPTAATCATRSGSRSREGHITQHRGRRRRRADARLARRGPGRASDRDPYAVSHVGWGLNPQCRWDCARPLRRRAGAQPRGGAQLPRQLPVLHRPEHAGRRQAHDARPLRRADARLHDRARRQHRGRGRPHRRPEDDRRPRRALSAARLPRADRRPVRRRRAARRRSSRAPVRSRACMASCLPGCESLEQVDERPLPRGRGGGAGRRQGALRPAGREVTEPLAGGVRATTRGEEGGNASTLQADSEITPARRSPAARTCDYALRGRRSPAGSAASRSA